MPSLTTYKLLKQEHDARRGEFKTVHGTVQTPAFQNEKIEVENDLPYLNISNGQIVFENMSFKYEEDSKMIINKLSVKIPGKSKVLIKGRNGSGKTTLLKLIMGLYTNYTGYIYIDNKDIKNYRKASIRNQISIVSQNYFFIFRNS